MVKKYPQSSPKEIIDVSPSDDETQSINIVDQTGYPVLTFDADDYREYVQDMDLTEKQEQELLQALWSIIVQFVDLGFGIESVQRATLATPCSRPSDVSQEETNKSVVEECS